MKILNEKHEVIIESYFMPVNDNAEDGEITEHNRYIKEIYFYAQQEDYKHIRISLTKNMILDIADQIREIEKEIKMLPFEKLPF